MLMVMARAHQREGLAVKGLISMGFDSARVGQREGLAMQELSSLRA